MNNLKNAAWAFGHQAQNRINFEFGTRSDDVLMGTEHTDFIFGFSGDDTIYASAGLDVIDGQRGFDTMVYDGSILDADISLSGLRRGPHHGLNASTAIVTLSDESGIVTSRDVLKNVEALFFAADDYTLYLNGTNNAVLAGDDTAATTENAAIVLTDLLANDRDFDGDRLTITAVDATSALGATVTMADGQITYTPAFDSLAEGEVVEDSFTYTVDDGFGGQDVATVTVTVTGTNDAPVLTLSDAAITVEESTTSVTTVAAATWMVTR
ncbi:Ig-like domain-containing protein [Arenibacterium sp. LLYu02]|uniref:Ig-like domain-containing protein n=1 Tax=Arenibacterium sp. LLYu02 TaxID=3404132 RepID=UPI003B21BC8C